VVTKTTARSHDEHDDNEQDEFEEETTRSLKKRKSTTRSLAIAAKLAASQITTSSMALTENSACKFQGNMPDTDHCQCKKRNTYCYSILFTCVLVYYMCTDDLITRVHCPDRQLFDDDSRMCLDYRKVFCASRRVNDRDIDPCPTNMIQS
jgi:hypothetical protein